MNYLTIFALILMNKILLPCAILCAMLMACAGSSNDSNDAEKARAHANAGYKDLNSEAQVQQNAPEAEQKVVPANVKMVQGSILPALAMELCPEASNLRGVGIAMSEQEAKLLAQKDIASQIQSSVTAEIRSVAKQAVSVDGNSFYEESQSRDVVLNSHLENAADARAVSTLYNGNEFGILACMSREDAAKPFVLDYEILRDSLLLTTSVFEKILHPVEKQGSYENSLELYLRYKAVLNVLKTLEVKVDSISKADSAFAWMQAAYSTFRSEYKLYFVADENEFANAAFSQMSKKYPLQRSACESGLCLNFDVTEPRCKEGGLGVSCAVDLSLRGSSVAGEEFFRLQAVVKGNGRYEQSEAIEALQKNLNAAAWLDAWKTELDKWNLK